MEIKENICVRYAVNRKEMGQWRKENVGQGKLSFHVTLELQEHVVYC